MTQIWKIGENWECKRQLGNILRDKKLIIHNRSAMPAALRAFFQSLPGGGPWPDPLPPDFPRPDLEMTDESFTPDHFIMDSRWYVSKALMNAMALPDWAVSYVATTTRGAEAARQKQYHYMQLRAFADAIDYDRSDCRTTVMKSNKTGNPFRFVEWLSRISLNADLQPPCDLFEDKTSGSDCFATDALAQRVLAAGCTGMDFVHPSWFGEADGRRVLRTATGIVRTGLNGEMASATPISPESADAGPSGAAAASLDDYLDRPDARSIN